VKVRPATALVLLVALGFGVSGCDRPAQRGVLADTIEVRSEAFAEGGEIPERFSCEGENISPPLSWSKLPDGARELALVLSDPDATDGTFYHWVLVGIDPSKSSLAVGEVPPGAVVAESSSGMAAYIGMCPPDGSTHRYVFTLYALNRQLEPPVAGPPQATLDAIEDAAVARGTLTARFSR